MTGLTVSGLQPIHYLTDGKVNQTLREIYLLNRFSYTFQNLVAILLKCY